MEDGYTEIYTVEFRGLSSHYLATDAIQAAFRYASGSFAVSSQDYVGLFSADQAGSAVAEVRVKVGDPSLHRPCDGGIWKQGVVTIPSSELPTTGGAHRLCYVNRLGAVCGTSATFILCRDMSEFPSITIQSTEDHVLIAKLREQSPPTMSFEHVDECVALEAVGMRTTSSSAGSSFQIVTEEKKVEVDTESLREERTQESNEAEDQLAGQQAPVAMVEESLHLRISACGREVHSRGEDRSNQSHDEERSPHKFELKENTASVESPLSEKVECVGEGIEGSEMTKDLSLSESTVLVEHVNASEGWRAKQQNKELREKLRILTAKMTRMKSNQEELERKLSSEQQANKKLRDELSLLRETIAELEEKILEVEEQKSQTEADNSELLEKVDQLGSELKVISEHDRQLLQQIQAYKTELCVLRSEKEVVEERLQHMEKRRRAKHAAAMADKERDHHHHHDKKEESHQTSKTATKHEQLKACAPLPRHKPSKLPKLTPPVDQSQHGTRDKQPQPQSQPAAARPAKLVKGMPGAAPAPAMSQTNGLSEDRIQEITRKLKGTESFYECPICHKQLLSRESEYSASLHVEHCIRNYQKC